MELGSKQANKKKFSIYQMGEKNVPAALYKRRTFIVLT